MKGNALIIVIIIISIFGILFAFKNKATPALFTTRVVDSQNTNPIFPIQTTPSDVKNVEIVAQNLTTPWEIVFLPNKDILVTERGGKLLKVGSQNKLVKEIEGVKQTSEGGLLGMALHPNFSSNGLIYLYSTSQESGKLINRVERYKLSGDTLSDRTVVITGIRGSSLHDGGRIAFGPDKNLYITTGDSQIESLSQDKNSLNGKILRIKDDGSIPSDNPYGNAVYSMGHRNPQGLAWDKNGTLWETEHGPSLAQTGYDEINLITKGGNYGWPTIKGDQTKEGLISPIIQSGSSDTWAPSGMAYLNGSLFFSGLRGQALYEAKIGNDNKLKLFTHFKTEFGRIRAVTIGPDGFIYISTSNRDGRGDPKDGDDKIIKINPSSLN